MNEVEAGIAALGTEHSPLALWALRYMHHTKAVDGLISAFNDPANEELKEQILLTLARLYQREAPYDGSWWRSTRPDTHGPYYRPETWEASERSEEHTSELQSLMRISYAVFCLKKKNT